MCVCVCVCVCDGEYWIFNVAVIIKVVIINIIYSGEDESLAEWTKEVENYKHNNVVGSSDDPHVQHVTSTRLQVNRSLTSLCLCHSIMLFS